MRALRTVSMALVTLMLVSMVSVCISDEDSATGVSDGQYGSTRHISSAEFSDAIKDITGKSLSEWIDDISAHMTYYNIDSHSLTLNSDIALTRNTDLGYPSYEMKDRLAGYLEAVLDLTITGNFPAAGTYQAKEGENVVEFLDRVFVEERSVAERTVHISYDINLYYDVTADTCADMDIGELLRSQTNLRFALYDRESRDIDLDLKFTDDGDPQSLMIDYVQTDVNNNFYLNLNTGITFEGMKMFSADPLELNPKATAHITKSLISSDLADSIWIDLLASGGMEVGNVNLAELILKILGSGGRTLDLFDTIKSLTSSDVPDVTFSVSMDASKYTDASGYEYCKVVSKKTGGPTFYLPYGPYRIDGAMINEAIPDDLPADDRVKIALDALVLAFFLDPVEVKDISGDETTRQKCAEVRAYADGKLDVEEQTNYTIPAVYLGLAIAGLAAASILFILMRRRLI